jgi:hypothetical protein
MNEQEIKDDFYERMAEYLLGTKDGYPTRIMKMDAERGHPFAEAYDSSYTVPFQLRGPDGKIHEGSITFEELPKNTPSSLTPGTKIPENEESENFDQAAASGHQRSPDPGFIFYLDIPNLSFELYESVRVQYVTKHDQILGEFPVEKINNRWGFQTNATQAHRLLKPLPGDNHFLVFKRSVHKTHGLPRGKEFDKEEEWQVSIRKNKTVIEGDRRRLTEVYIDGKQTNWGNLSKDEKAEILLPIAVEMDRACRAAGNNPGEQCNFALELLFELYPRQADQLATYFCEEYLRQERNQQNNNP